MFLRVVIALALGACGRLGYDPLGSEAADSGADPVGVAPLVHFPLADDPSEGLILDRARGLKAMCEAGQCPTLEMDGPFGACHLFDGSNDRFDVQSDTLLDDAMVYTVSGWARLDDDSVRFAALLAKPEGSSTGNTWELEYTDGQPTFTTSGDGLKAPPTTVGRWQHLTGTFDGTIKRLYVDGVLANMTPQELRYGPRNMVVGGDYNSGNLAAPFLGCLSDIRVYDQALSASQVATLAALP